MKRNLVALLSVLAVVCLAGSAWAQGLYGDGGGESAPGCICEETVGGVVRSVPDGPSCTNMQKGSCADPVCVTNDDCLSTQVCISSAFTNCTTNVCVPLDPVCVDGGCAVSSSVIGGIIFCPNNNIPTLSQWGVILFGMLLLTMMYLTIRRRGLPTQMTASLLVLLTVGVLAVGASYAEIQSNRVCGETDVAVDFVNNILNS